MYFERFQEYLRVLNRQNIIKDTAMKNFLSFFLCENKNCPLKSICIVSKYSRYKICMVWGIYLSIEEPVPKPVV